MHKTSKVQPICPPRIGLGQPPKNDCSENMFSVKPVLWASDRNVLINHLPMPPVGARRNFSSQPYSRINRTHILQIVVIADMFCNSNFYSTVRFFSPSVIVNSVQFYLFWSVFY